MPWPLGLAQPGCLRTALLLGRCLSALELSAAAVGFFGGWRVATIRGLLVWGFF